MAHPDMELPRLLAYSPQDKPGLGRQSLLMLTRAILKAPCGRQNSKSDSPKPLPLYYLFPFECGGIREYERCHPMTVPFMAKEGCPVGQTQSHEPLGSRTFSSFLQKKKLCEVMDVLVNMTRGIFPMNASIYTP